MAGVSNPTSRFPVTHAAASRPRLFRRQLHQLALRLEHGGSGCVRLAAAASCCLLLRHVRRQLDARPLLPPLGL